MTHIKSKTGLLEVNLGELYHYRDLIYLLFKRNYITRYKQTILGPLWLVLNPLITVCLYAVVFGNLAGLSDSNVPQIVFYLAGNSLWAFFAASLTQTSATFTANVGIMGKVYFPRLVMPLSSVLSGLFDLLIQLAILIVFMLYFFIKGFSFNLDINLLYAPVLVLQTGLLGLGCGIIIASLTTKYRDLAVLVGFGVQLWMYATPVVYSLKIIPEKFMHIYLLNPMSPIMLCWRKSVIGVGAFPLFYWGVSWITTFVVLAVGILIFNKIEKTFMDTV